MTYRAWLIGLAGCLLMATTAQAQTQTAPFRETTHIGATGLGACMWDHVSEDDRQSALAAFHVANIEGILTHINDFTAALAAKDADFKAARVQCDARGGAPAIMYQEVVTARALRAGAAAELLASRHIDQAALDDDWAKASKPARECIYASVLQLFHVAGGGCTDLKSVLEYATRLGLDPKASADRNDSALVFMYMNAQGQTDVAEALVTDYEAGAEHVAPKS